MERILIAVDVDDAASEAAVEQGLALAAAEGTRVVFVHVTSILGEEFAADGSNVSRAPERANVPVLRDALASAERAGVPADSELLVGFPATQIAALADELDADLVIVGSRHFKGAKRMLHGSTSRTLLDETRRSLLIVTEPAHEPALV